MAQNSHIFLVKASHMTKPDLKWARETSTFHREMEQVIKNNDIVSHGSLYLKCHHLSLLFPILQTVQSYLITTFVKFFCCHWAISLLLCILSGLWPHF